MTQVEITDGDREVDELLTAIIAAAEEMLGHQCRPTDPTISFGMACYRAGQAQLVHTEAHYA